MVATYNTPAASTLKTLAGDRASLSALRAPALDGPMDLNEPPIVQLQRATHRLLPVIVLLVASRSLLVGVLSFSKFIVKKSTRERLARLLAALERAGVASASLSLVLAFAFSGDELIRESSGCFYPTSPRPHALIFTSALFLLMSTSRFVCVFLSLATLLLIDLQFAGAWFTASLALVEWTKPVGLASELLAMTAHSGTLVYATAYQGMCAPRHDKAAGILTAISYVGCLSWSATLFRRHVAKRILTSLQSHARTR